MSRLKKFLGLVIIIGFLMFGGVIGNQDVFLKKDFRILVVAEDGIGLVSVSDSRGMTNVLKVKGDVMVWVPGGYSWYRADKIKQLLTIEKIKDKAVIIGFFNFGFLTKKVIFCDSIENWEDWQNLGKSIGYVPGTYLKMRMSNLFFDEYEVGGQTDADSWMGQVLTREFSSSTLIEEDIKVSIFNGSSINQLATFLADRLNWAGMRVITIADYGEDTECRLNYGAGMEKSQTWQYLLDIFDKNSGCEFVMDENVLESEVEIVLDEEWAQMINYDSYVRSF